MYVVIFCTTFVCNISHSKKNRASYCHKCTQVSLSSTHYSCQILMKINFSRHVLEKISNVKFIADPFIGSRVVPCRQTDLTKLSAVLQKLQTTVHIRESAREFSLLFVGLLSKCQSLFERSSDLSCQHRFSRFSCLASEVPVATENFSCRPTNLNSSRIVFLASMKDTKIFLNYSYERAKLEIVFFFRLHPIIINFIHNLILYATFVGVRSLML